MAEHFPMGRPGPVQTWWDDDHPPRGAAGGAPAGFLPACAANVIVAASITNRLKKNESLMVILSRLVNVPSFGADEK